MDGSELRGVDAAGFLLSVNGLRYLLNSARPPHLSLVPFGLDITDRETRAPPGGAAPIPYRRRKERRRISMKGGKAGSGTRGRKSPRTRRDAALDASDSARTPHDRRVQAAVVGVFGKPGMHPSHILTIV